MPLLFLISAVVLHIFTFSLSTVQASDDEAYMYLKTIGETSEKVQWCVQKSNPLEMLYATTNEKSITKTDEKLATLQWQITNSIEKTHIQALRDGEEIHLTGYFKGEPVDKKIAIDQAPWYQSTSWSLRNFILSADKTQEFWLLRGTNLKPYKVQVTKIGEEALTSHTNEPETIKVELRIQGILSHFWKSHYWFRKSDGVFLRFEGASGPPGSPLAVVEYMQQMSLCNFSVADAGNQPFFNIGDI